LLGCNISQSFSFTIFTLYVSALGVWAIAGHWLKKRSNSKVPGFLTKAIEKVLYRNNTTLASPVKWCGIWYPRGLCL
jgi:hypothetical protein